VATFSYLPPGKYRFEVQASKGDGRWLPGVGTLHFTVRAAWWETAAFRVSVTVAGLLALAWVVRRLALRRLRARMLRLEQENALERERARIARDMHDELGASLTRISLMGELAAAEPGVAAAAGERFMKVAAAARDVSGTLDRIVWTINPNNDTLERLVGYLDEFAREYLESTGLSLRSELPATLPARVVPSDTRHQLLLAMKEALNNIAKHAGARQVVLRFVFENNRLALTLTDDGHGFHPVSVSPTANGLINLQKRMDALGGTAVIVSEPGAGTTVTLALPLPG
jgi:signal transduction histidine kinase